MPVFNRYVNNMLSTKGGVVDLTKPNTVPVPSVSFTSLSGAAIRIDKGQDVSDFLDLIANEAADLQSNAVGASPTDLQTGAALIKNIGTYYGLINPVFANPTYEQFVSVSCRGLSGNGQLDKVLLTLTPVDPLLPAIAVTKEVDVTCAPTVALTAGVTFTNNGSYTYSANAGPVAPGGTPPPTSPVTQSPPGSRPLVSSPAAYLHFALPWPSNDDVVGLQLTLVGAPVIGSTSSSGTPFLQGGVGLSVSLWDALYFTGGENYGSRTEPLPGYGVGTPITTGASVPTQSVPKWGFFLGVSGRIP